MSCSFAAADERARPKRLRMDEKALVLVLLFELEPGLLGGQVREHGVDEKGGRGARVREVEFPEVYSRQRRCAERRWTRRYWVGG